MDHGKPHKFIGSASNVSTAILIFTKTNAGGTDKVWFYDMRADGFSLDQKRNEVSENDIPDIISRFHNRKKDEAERKRTEQSFLVPQSEIIENCWDFRSFLFAAGNRPDRRYHNNFHLKLSLRLVSIYQDLHY